MRVTRLILRDFRNYEHLEFIPCPAVNILHGANAAGKTNVLEALNLVGLGRSHRGARDADMVRSDGAGYAVVADIDRQPVPMRIELLHRVGGRKEARLNGVRQPRLSDILGQFNVIIFSPEDLQLVKGSPVLRRRYLDFTLAQLSPAYGHALTRYNEALTQRNSLLRDVASQRASHVVLDVWDEQLAENGAVLLRRRQTAMERISELASLEHQRITEGREELQASYQPSPSLTGDGGTAEFLSALRESRPADLARGQTLVGPHRDDIHLQIAGRSGRQFASQGQQRTAALALKLAALSFIAAETGEHPVLLLDDVFSELDETRRRCLIETISDSIQTFITTTDRATIGDIGVPIAVFAVGDGRLEREE